MIKQKYFIHAIIYTILLLVPLFAVYGHFDYHSNPLSMWIAYGQNSDTIKSIETVKSTNETNLYTSYDALLTNKYPAPVEYVTKLNPGAAIIYEGIVISKDSKPEEIKFDKWGVSNNLNLDDYLDRSRNLLLYNIEGNSYGNSAGFMSSTLKSDERYLSMNFGGIYKSPGNAQIVIQLDVVGSKSNYQLFFVNGRLAYEGWYDNNYYEKITSNSSQLVDLVEIISSKEDKFLYLNDININVEKDTEVDSFQFRIDLGNSTINTPGLIRDGAFYIVNGYVFQGDIPYTNYRYEFDDWQFRQVLSQEFIVNSVNQHFVAANGWNVKEITKSEDNITNGLRYNLISEKNVPVWDVPLLEAINYLDLYTSVLQVGGPKDVFFVVIIALLIILAFSYRKGIFTVD